MNFHSPFSEPPSFFFFLIPQILTGSIIIKIHPPFQNPGSAPAYWCNISEFQFLDLVGNKIILHTQFKCLQLFFSSLVFLQLLLEVCRELSFISFSETEVFNS